MNLIENNTMQQASLEHMSRKQLNELERSVQDLITTMRKTKLQDETLQESLRLLAHKLGEARRERFDEVNSEYKGY